MKNTSPLAGIALAVCLLGVASTPAWADQEVSVGRVDVQLPGDGWQVFGVDDKGNSIPGVGESHQQATETKMFYRVGAGNEVDTIMVVRADGAGRGRYTGIRYPNAKCQGAVQVFAEGDDPGPGARSFRCLQVTAPFDFMSSPEMDEAQKQSWAKSGYKPPVNVFVVSAGQYAYTGAFAHVVVYVRADLAGAQPSKDANGSPEAAAKPVADLPAGVSANGVLWGRKLQAAVTDSVYSLGGDLTVPPLAFEPAPGTGNVESGPKQPADASPVASPEPGKG